MIQHLFSDMDGTLLNSQGRLSDKNAELILQAGIPMTLVSARAPIEMQPAIAKLQLTGAQIAFNGGLIFLPHHGEFTPLVEAPLSQRSAAALLTTVANDFPAVSLSWYDQSHWFAPKIDAGIEYEASLTELAPKLVQTPVAEAAAHTVFKVMLITFDEAEMERLEAALHALQLPDVAIQRSGGAYLEITAATAKKSTGIQYILQQAHLAKADTAAFGDGHNDLPMLEAVGTPIAMANAQQAVKDVCVHITDGNDEDGVGVGIHRYLLK